MAVIITGSKASVILNALYRYSIVFFFFTIINVITYAFFNLFMVNNMCVINQIKKNNVYMFTESVILFFVILNNASDLNPNILQLNKFAQISIKSRARISENCSTR